jgi:hypothetical protein
MSRQQITDMVRTTKKRSNGLVKFPHQGLENAGLALRDGISEFEPGEHLLSGTGPKPMR